MTLRRTTKIIESPKGTGRVLAGDKELAKVNYELNVEAEEILAKPFYPGRKARIGRLSVHGEVSLVEGSLEVPFPSGFLTLVLEDGRKVSFQIDRREPMLDGKFAILGFAKL